MSVNEKIAVIGLGYVGLPVAIALAAKFQGVVGFDIKQARVAALARGEDNTREVSASRLRETTLQLTSNLYGVHRRGPDADRPEPPAGSAPDDFGLADCRPGHEKRQRRRL
jgi:3-hydroxyacyl-CoA dehydrogenase